MSNESSVQTPTSDMLVADIKTVEPALFLALSAMAGLGCCLTLFFLYFNIRYRALRVLKMSSPNINSLILIGSILLYTSSTLFGLDFYTKDDTKSATLLCQIRTWLLCVSFTLVFGAMFTKAWRVHRIFKHAAVKRVVIRDNKLFLFIGILLVIDGIILGLWQGLDPLTTFFHYTQSMDIRTTNATSYSGILKDNDIRTLAYQVCKSEFFPLWGALIFFYKAFLLLYGTYLAWKIKNVTLPSMNDSKCIIFSAYTTVIVGGITVAMAISLEEWPNAVYVCLSAGIMFCTTSVQCSVFIPKIILWKKNKDEEMLKTVNMSAHIMNMSHDQSVQRIEEEMYHLVAENRTLKKSLSEKDTTIQTLQEHVNNAKSKMNHFMEEGRQDSGLDVDLSTSSADNVPGMVTKMDDNANKMDIKDNLKVKRSNSISSIKSWLWGERRSKHRSSNRSMSSIASFHNMSKLRDSIADDLNNAHALSCDLRNSISHDLVQTRPHNRNVYDYMRSKQDLAGSIANSYDFSDDSDTYSYVNSHLPYCEYHSRFRDPFSQWGAQSSCESVYAIESDKFYPQNIQEKKRKKRSKRIGKPGQWKQEPKPKVYTIQEPMQPQFLGSSGIALTRALNENPETGTFV